MLETSDGHEVEYRFAWGDGTVSEWGGRTQTKGWPQNGMYDVQVMVRCQAHPGVVSGWSAPLNINVVPGEGAVVWSVSFTDPEAPAQRPDGFGRENAVIQL